MINEFRQDPVSGDWVLIATGRASKPHPKEDRLKQSIEECVFEPERLSEQEVPVAIYNKGNLVSSLSEDWTTVVLPNKFPAVKKGVCGAVAMVGPFSVAEGNGFHELVITRDHDKSFAQFTEAETAEVLTIYRERYLAISKDDCGEYISIFHNHGHLAGASVYHNHSQILSMPIISSTCAQHLRGAEEYYKKTGQKIHEAILNWELKENKRIIHQNENFVVLCPYASSSAYEIKIFPKRATPYFEDITEEEIPAFANALSVSLKKLYSALDNIDYMFFIHTAPPKKEGVPINESYSWHLEIMPRSSIIAGQEFGTGVFVNTVDPDEAAELLRKTDV
ncbi:MAG: DUF4921 family protein [Patescibacteria group bacterium]